MILSFVKALSLILIFLGVNLLIPSMLAAESKVITLTDTKGRDIQAKIVAVEDDAVKIVVKGKEVMVPLEKLSEESRQAVKDAIAGLSGEDDIANTGKLVLPDGKAIIPGQVQSFTMKLTQEEQDWSPKIDLISYKASVAFPPNFDPSKPYPIYFVNDTLPGKNADKVKGVAKVANEAGYVVIGAQAFEVGEGQSTKSWDVRGHATYSAIFELLKNWPSLDDSDWYFGGNSGGAKNCCYLSVYLYEVHDHRPAGFFMGGCNEMMMTRAIDSYKSDKKAFRKAAFFVSNGNEDKIAPPDKGEQVAKELKKDRFKNVRQEVFEGGHGMSREHFAKALKWFDELREETKE